MSEKKSSSFQSLFVAIVIPLVLVISVLIHMYIFGDPNNFELDGGHPVSGMPGWLFGTIYKGGFIVPILLAVNIIIIVFSVERFINIFKAKGRGRTESFISEVRSQLAADRLDEAIELCDNQQGSVANVVRSGLEKYKAVLHDSTMDKESKITAVKQELEESTALELPMLSKNLVIISTCASISTLIGLIGTVLGMIRAFGALASSGTPDAAALSSGISEALINTAFGITGSTVAIIMYNYFSNRIDAITHGIDEAGFSVSQTVATKSI